MNSKHWDTDPELARASDQLGVIERVTPKMLATVDQIVAHTHACLADLGYTPEDWKGWDDDQREAFLTTWRHKHGRKHPDTWPPTRAEWVVPRHPMPDWLKGSE